MANSGNSKETYIFIWKIKNIYLSELKSSRSICSPTFHISNFKDTIWNIQLHLGGDDPENIEFISGLLQREDDKGPEIISIEYNIYVDHPRRDSYRESNFTKKCARGYPLLMPSISKLQSESSLTITCEMRFSKSTCSDFISRSEIFFPLATISNSKYKSTPAVNVEIQTTSDACRSEKNLSTPNQCVAQTQFCFERTSFDWPVSFPLVDGRESKQVIPAVLLGNYVVIVLSKNKKNDAFIDASFRILKETTKKLLIVTCQLSVLVNDSEFFCLPEEKWMLNSEKLSEWKLKVLINRFEIKTQWKECFTNSVSWNFEFKFVDGRVHSEILYEECINASHNSLPIDLPIVSKQISLISKDIIESLDEDLKNELASYKSTGTLNNLGFKKAQKLYMVANQYEIIPLLKFCRYFLIKNICNKNIYEALLLAEKCKDEKLRKESIQLIIYSSDILNSDEWKLFESKHLALACKILREVILFSK